MVLFTVCNNHLANINLYRMSQYYQEIGCKVNPPTDADKKKYRISSKVEASMHRIARLKLPLEFPKARLGRKRK